MQGKATFRGHPLHPMLVLFPIAFWFGSLIADILYFATDTDFWTTLGTGLIAAAILCALLAAAAGFIDYFAAPRDATTTRAVTEHMVLSFLIVTAYSANLYLRVHTPEIPAGYLLSVLAILALMNSGGLGGDLVHNHQVGVEEPADRERWMEQQRRMPAGSPTRR